MGSSKNEREQAGRMGIDFNTIASTLLVAELADDPDNLTEAEMAAVRAGIQCGLRNGECG